MPLSGLSCPGRCALREALGLRELREPLLPQLLARLQLLVEATALAAQRVELLAAAAHGGRRGALLAGLRLQALGEPQALALVAGQGD